MSGGAVVRCYAEPVQVQRRDDAPEQVLWRGRLYLVREVLARWVEAGGWWRGPGEAASTAPLTDPDRHYWRVEVSAGRSGAPAVLDLCLDEQTGGWSVARSLD